MKCMGSLRDLIWGSPEARRRKRDLQQKKQTAYQTGLEKGISAREANEITLSEQHGYEAGFAMQSSRKARVLKGATKVGKGAVRVGRGLQKIIQSYQPPEVDPFTGQRLFSQKKRRRKR
jgi:hypothetical protein